MAVSDFTKLNPSKNKAIRKSMPEGFFEDVKEMTRHPKENWKRHHHRPPTPKEWNPNKFNTDPIPTGTGPVSLLETPKSEFLVQEETEETEGLQPLKFAKGGAIMQREVYSTGGGTSIKSIIKNLLPSLYGKNTKAEKKGSLDFGYQPSFLYQPRVQKQEGGELDAQMTDMMEEPTHTMPDGTVMPGATHEEYEETMIPDEQMEEDYTDFIIGESLTPEDEEYLLNALEQDDRLSMIFDQVVDTASEFSGSGSVTGPGTEMSDSIPARLSDGEFVMTSKAANQIGPDNLQGLMEVAEMEADNEGRQIKQAGGYVEEEENEEQEIVRAIQSKEEAGRVMPTSLADKKVNESMIALNPRNSLFAT